MPLENPDYLFQPLIPEWLLFALDDRWSTYPVEYATLAGKYAGDPDTFYAGPSVNLDMVNAYSAAAPVPFGTFPGPFVLGSKHGGADFPKEFWPRSTPPPQGGGDFLYWGAMCFALELWQMYNTSLAQQIQRFAVLGYYGRKRKD